MNANDTKNKIQENLIKFLQKYTGIQITDKKSLIEDIKRNLQNQLKQTEPDYYINRVEFLWNHWSFKKKLIWFWKIKLRFGRQEFDLYKSHKYCLQNTISNIHLQIAPNISPEISKDQISPIDLINKTPNELFQNFNDKFEKWWFHLNPKDEIIVDIFFKLPIFANYIKVTMEIPKDS